MLNNVTGQTEVKAQLQALLESGRMPHALLLCGPQGVGQMAVAVALAQELLHCQGILHPDLHYVYPVYKPKGWPSERKAVSDDFAPQWREQLQSGLYFDRQEWADRIGLEGQKFQIGVGESDQILRKLSLVSSQGGWKVMIIYLAELMSTEAANKLLKILEEPTPQTLFILVTEQSELLLDTITSRTQRIDLRPLSEDTICQALIEQREVSPEMARQTAHICGGNMTRALQMLRTDDQTRLYFEMFQVLMRQAYTRQVRELYRWSEQVAQWSRAEQRQLLQYFQQLLRENFMYNFGQPSLNYMKDEEREFATRFARFINERNIIPFYEQISTAQRDIAQNTNPRMVFFDLALQTTLLLRQ